MFYETAKNDHGLQYNPFKACVTPRPIAWITSLNEDGSTNIGPYSYYNAICDIPPMIAFSSSYKPNHDIKDSLRNIVRTGEFVVNIVSYSQKDLMNATSAPLEYGKSEADEFEVPLADSNLVATKRIVVSSISMECKLVKTVDLDFDSYSPSSKLIIGHVVGIHIDDQCIKDGRVDAHSLDVIARLGYNQYARISDIFEMKKS